MKKDIDSLIAEERTEIIAKYDRVSVCTGVLLLKANNTENPMNSDFVLKVQHAAFIFIGLTEQLSLLLG